MNIIKAINELQAAIKANQIFPANGVFVERQPTGTRVGLLADAPGASAWGWHGMFEMVDASEIIDGELIYKVKVINGNDPENESCGIAHVNNQPFVMQQTVIIMPEDVRKYIYVGFAAPVEATETAEAIPATAVIGSADTPQESTDKIAYHLIGQAWVEEESLRLSQDHIPGNIYMTWYGPCLGLLEE